MKIICAAFLIVALLFLSVSSASAQAAEITLPETPLNNADQEWESLKLLGKVTRPRSASSDPAEVERARQKFTAELLRDADRLKNFQARNPEHSKHKEAKRLEALFLVRAWQAGETTQELRRKQLVEAIRSDATLDPAARSEVAALADHLTVAKNTALSRSEKLSAYEEVLRGLTAEFPMLPNGYEALVNIAKDSPDERALAIVRDVLAMPQASNPAKAEAQTLLDRFALLGKSLPELVRPIVGPDHAMRRAHGQPVVIYSWASSSRGSIVRAKAITGNVPPGAVVVGVCLDRQELESAKSRAVAERLPGEQVFDALGRHGVLAGRLNLTDHGLIYLADGNGIIRSVSAHRDLAAAFAALPIQ